MLGFYRRFLGRDAEPAGRDAFLDSIHAGASYERVVSVFVGSQESFDRHVSGSLRATGDLHDAAFLSSETEPPAVDLDDGTADHGQPGRRTCFEGWLEEDVIEAARSSHVPSPPPAGEFAEPNPSRSPGRDSAETPWQTGR